VEALIRLICNYIALSVEATAAAMIAYGTIEALVRLAPALVGRGPIGRRRDVWRRFGIWLLLGLEFELAADIVRSAIAPTWTDIGQLASIAAIRTFLNYFLESDIEKLGTQDRVDRMSSATPPVP
jgi:uncharacterized membrane protein